MSDTYSFKCAACGSAVFDIPDNPDDDDVITCTGCGAVGSYSEIQSEAMKMAQQDVMKTAQNIFKGFGKK